MNKAKTGFSALLAPEDAVLVLSRLRY